MSSTNCELDAPHGVIQCATQVRSTRLVGAAGNWGWGAL